MIEIKENIEYEFKNYIPKNSCFLDGMNLNS
jgi:hypothetical protein